MTFLICPDSSSQLGSAIEKINAIEAGQRLVIQLPSGRDLAEALLASYRAGVIAVPIDPKAPERYRTEIIRKTAAAALLDGTGFTFLGNGEVRETDKDGRIILFTSGSTGDPKGVLLKDHAIRHNAKVVRDLHNFAPGRVHASPLPLYHGNALNMSLFASWFHGSTAVLLSRFDPVSFFDTLRTYKVQTASLVPALIRRLLDARKQWPDDLEYIITAAAPLPRSMAREFYKLYGPRLRQGYGLSETVNFSTKMPKLNDKDFVHEYLDNDPPVGLPVNETSIRISEGEVQIKSPGIFSEYWRNEAATQLAFTSDGWFRTGDMGHFRGPYLVLHGRSKEVINRGGETIYPVDVEEHWRQEGLKGRICVYRIQNNYLTDDIGLRIDTDQGAAHILEILNRSSWWRPSYVVKDMLLTTSTGKPMRSKMGEHAYSHIIVSMDDLKNASAADQTLLLFKDLIENNAKHLSAPTIPLDSWTSEPEAKDGTEKKVYYLTQPVRSSPELNALLVKIVRNACKGSYVLFPFLAHQTLQDLLAAGDRREKSAAPDYSREQILSEVESITTKWGFSLVRSGKYELGGVIWVEI